MEGLSIRCFFLYALWMNIIFGIAVFFYFGILLLSCRLWLLGWVCKFIVDGVLMFGCFWKALVRL